MSRNTHAEQCERSGSQGGKTVTCVRCKTDIQPYAGRRVAAYRDAYAHHPGQCADSKPGEDTLRSLADQPGLFAWQCAHIEPAGDLPMICREVGDDRAEFEAHMRGHGATQLRPAVAPIRLRKSSKPPAPKFAPVDVVITKRLAWTEKHYAGWVAGVGNERLPDTEHRGQFWSAGEAPHSVWAIEDRRAAGLPNRLVQLYVRADGSVTPDWSDAKYSRREANRVAKRHAA